MHPTSELSKPLEFKQMLCSAADIMERLSSAYFLSYVFRVRSQFTSSNNCLPSQHFGLLLQLCTTLCYMVAYTSKNAGDQVNFPEYGRKFRVNLKNHVLFKVVDILEANFLCWGGSPEYLYPLPAVRINGYFRLLGPRYGGIVALILTVLFLLLVGLYVAECCLYRYMRLSIRWRSIYFKTIWFLPINICLSIGGAILGYFMAGYFLLDVQVLCTKVYSHSSLKIKYQQSI